MGEHQRNNTRRFYQFLLSGGCILLFNRPLLTPRTIECALGEVLYFPGNLVKMSEYPGTNAFLFDRHTDRYIVSY